MQPNQILIIENYRLDSIDTVNEIMKSATSLTSIAPAIQF